MFNKYSKMGIRSEGYRNACTRKTDWGLLDNGRFMLGKASHRLSRADALMIRRTTWLLLLAYRMNCWCRCRRQTCPHAEFVVVEVRDECQALFASRKWDEMQKILVVVKE